MSYGYTGNQRHLPSEKSEPVKHPQDRPGGYTGFVPRIDKEEALLKALKPEVNIQGNGKQIPGYTGYIPQIKAEGVAGFSYGQATKLQSRGQLPLA
jgi:hypothetical protein